MKSVRLELDGDDLSIVYHIMRYQSQDYRLIFAPNGILVRGIDKKNTDYEALVPSWNKLIEKFPDAKAVFNIDTNQNLDFVGWWQPLQDIKIVNIDEFLDLVEQK